jgi:phosphatidylglycerol:prolipoprotein diacylglycerol transferase
VGIAFSIGNLDVHWYGIMIMLGVVSALTVAWFEAKRRGENPDHVLTLALLVVPLGVIGARVYHVIDLWDYYMANPNLIVGAQGLGIIGAVIGGAIGMIIYTRIRHLVTLRWLDIVAPGLILAQAVGRWGNFFNQELYGRPTTLPWGIPIDPAHRLAEYANSEFFHPLFFYEFLLNLTGAVTLLILGRKFKNWLRDGDIFLLYLIWYGIGRFGLEGLKPHVWELGGFPTARWITLVVVIIAIGVLIFRHRRRRTAD